MYPTGEDRHSSGRDRNRQDRQVGRRKTKPVSEAHRDGQRCRPDAQKARPRTQGQSSRFLLVCCGGVVGGGLGEELRGHHLQTPRIWGNSPLFVADTILRFHPCQGLQRAQDQGSGLRGTSPECNLMALTQIQISRICYPHCRYRKPRPRASDSPGLRVDSDGAALHSNPSLVTLAWGQQASSARKGRAGKSAKAMPCTSKPTPSLNTVVSPGTSHSRSRT